MVQKVQSQLDANEASGLNGITVIILIKCVQVFTPVGTRLFQISYDILWKPIRLNWQLSMYIFHAHEHDNNFFSGIKLQFSFLQLHTVFTLY